MAGTKVKDTPSSSAKTLAGKRSRMSLKTPSRNRKQPSGEQPISPKTPVRKRQRASDFATGKSSSKKRQRNHATPGKGSLKKSSKKSEIDTEEDEASVDEVLHQVRELMKSKSTSVKAKALAKALKRADEVFQNDNTGSSSSENESTDDTKEAIDDAEMLIDERPVGGKANELNHGSKNTPKREKQAHKPEHMDKPTKLCGASSNTDDDTSDEEADPAKHKAEIDALKKDDPAFYKFLEDNDMSLLDFDMSSDSEKEDDPDIDRERQEPVGRDNVENSDTSDSSEDENQRNIKSEKNSRRDNTADVRNALSGSDREKKANKVDDMVISGSEESFSEKSESDGDSDAMARDEPGRHEMNSRGARSKSTKTDKLSGDVDDVTGYSDDDEMDSEADAEAEAAAAAEAGLEAQHASDAEAPVLSDKEAKEGKRGKRKLTLVDTGYLRELKELLKSKRSSLKACKDLLRLLRAGRDILPSSPVSKDKKTKQSASGKKSKKSRVSGVEPELELEDADLDVYKDDGSFTSGKVRFASSKCYQQAMNLAIIGIQDALDKMLGKPERKQDTIEPLEVTWDPTDSNRWVNLEQVFRPFVFHLLALCEATKDADTLRFLLRRLEKLVPYTRENKVLLKKIAKVALHVWSSDPHYIGQMTKLRSYVLLTRLAHGPGNAETVLRACCNSYSSKISNVCNPKTLPLIHFATSCLVELFGIDMGASYTTAFSNLREMAISLRAVLISKDRKQEIERIHIWSYINKLRLFSQVLGRYGSEHELRPLIYPYVQISIGIMRAYPTPRTSPLRLHIASYLSDLMGATGVFIPVVPQLLSLLRCSELRKKGVHGSGSTLEWRSLLRVSDETVKTKPFLTGVINGVVYQIAKYFAIISKHVSFPEVAHFTEVTLKKTAKELLVGQWKMDLSRLAVKIHETSDMISYARSKADLSPHGAIHGDGMLAIVSGMDKERKMPIERFFEVEHSRVVKEESLRDEKQSDKQSRIERTRDEEDDSSESEEDGPTKKGITGKNKKRKQVVTLSVPNVNDSNDGEDEIGELWLESDSEEEDD